MFVVSMQSGCTNHRSIGSAQQLSTCPELKEWQESINGYSMVHLGGSVCTPYPGISNDVMFSYLSYLVNHEALLPIIDVMRENQPVQVALLKQYALGSCLFVCLLSIYINRLANPQTLKQILTNNEMTLAMSRFFYQLWLKWATNIFTNSSCRCL